MDSQRPLGGSSEEENVSTIARWHFVLIEVTAMFPAVTLAGIANGPILFTQL